MPDARRYTAVFFYDRGIAETQVINATAEQIDAINQILMDHGLATLAVKFDDKDN